jgi:NitT/TauT family transport system substrate-binding protein
MKKLLAFLLLLTSFGLLSCTPKDARLTLLVPSGSPSLAVLHLLADTEMYRVDVVNGSDPLLAAFASNSHDAIIAPTNLGARLYQSGMDYVFAGTINWGNFYLVMGGIGTINLAELQDKTIVVFGQNQTSDIILKYVLGANGIVAGFTYVDSVATASAMFLADQNLIILTAEPTFATLQSRVANLASFDLQAEYARLSGQESYPQAGLFVHKGLKPAARDALIAAVATSIDSVVSDVSAAADLAVTLEFGLSKAVLLEAIPNSRLNFVSAIDSKSALEAYFNMIMTFNPNLIGGSLPVDEFYLVP